MPRSTPNKCRYKAYVHSLGITKLYQRNPVVVALWSAIFPGMGHILLDKFLIGFALFAWEVVINYQANLNEAIFYSFTGRFQDAKNVLDLNWLLLYCPTYLFTIWDSYRTTVNMNKEFILACRDDLPVKPFSMSRVCINSLEKKSPWQALFWSLLVPGAGQMINHQIVLGLFSIITWIFSVYMSHLLPAIHLTMLGLFEKAKETLDIHWVLNIPSVYLFSAYLAFVSAVEINQLYEWEQARFLREEYGGTMLPAIDNNQIIRSNDNMLVVTTFEYSRSLETAITAIQLAGIPKDKIFAVPLDKGCSKLSLFDSTHNQDNQNTFDLPMIIAAVFSLFGLIYGFVFTLGPVLWALIGTGLGFGIGFAIKLICAKKKLKQDTKAQVVLIVQCDSNQIKSVEDTLHKFSFLKLGVLGHT